MIELHLHKHLHLYDMLLPLKKRDIKNDTHHDVTAH